MENLLVIDGTNENSYIELGEEIFHYIRTPYEQNKQLIILCIGTDRCTGDSLGPISGYKLKKYNLNNFFVYGTLENPIHAKNLSDYIIKINSTFKNPFIIAVDASLGKISNIGNINLKNTPLSPGLALNKDLPKVGDLSLTGIVNISGNFEFLVLQNTRLYTVMLLSNTIFKSFVYADKLLSKTLKKIINIYPQETKRS
ncbi:spore protease YyaC [Clostridium thermobutyricum]